jgi:hypothetical protein
MSKWTRGGSGLKKGEDARTNAFDEDRDEDSVPQPLTHDLFGKSRSIANNSVWALHEEGSVAGQEDAKPAQGGSEGSLLK